MSNLIYFRPEGSDLTLVGNGNREEEADPDAYNPHASMDFVQDIWPRWPGAYQAWPTPSSSPATPGCTPRPRPASVIDGVEGIEGLYVCTGFSGHGFKLSPAVGIVVAELILEGRSRTVDISALRMGRFAEGALNRTQLRLPGDSVGRSTPTAPRC